MLYFYISHRKHSYIGNRNDKANLTANRLVPTLLFAGILVSFIALSPITGYADSLVIPDISTQPESTPDDTPRPARAMTMDQVRDEFGAPLQTMGPIGNPPITRWVYDNFTVTFEGEYVIHSVAKRKQ